MGEAGAKGLLVAAILWLIIVAVLAVAFKFLVYPQLKGKLQEETGSASQYQHEVRLALDSFSGYCVLRSEPFRKQLKAAGIKLVLEDDKADYMARARALQKAQADVAVFPLNSLIETGVKISEFPATIVMIIDETKGADAIVSYRTAVSSLEDLNCAAGRMVFTPSSPSEFLARVVVAHFNLPDLAETWWVHADGAAEVYRLFKAAPKTEKRAYALWEPYVSKALAEPDAHVLLDSSRLKGHIVDVLVARRGFLKEQPALQLRADGRRDAEAGA